jgi:hypothetical protein
MVKMKILWMKRGWKLDAEYIVSLTSYDKRFEYCETAIKSLLLQKCRYAYEVRLYLAKEDVPPWGITDLERGGLKIISVEEDLKQYNKLLHVLRDEPEKTIITVDDDVYYPEDLIERLIHKSQEFPGCIVCHTGRFLSFDKDGRLRTFDDMQYNSGTRRVTPSLCLIPEGVGGVLYPPHVMDEIVFDSDLFTRITPRNDDLWFKMASLKKGTLCVQAEKWNIPLNFIPGSQSTGLHRTNFEGGNDSQLRACFEKYPEFLEKANAEFFSVPYTEEYDADESKRSTYFRSRSDYTGKKLLFYKYKYCLYRALSALYPKKTLRQKAEKYRRRIDASKFWQKMITQ